MQYKTISYYIILYYNHIGRPAGGRGGPAGGRGAHPPGALHYVCMHVCM